MHYHVPAQEMNAEVNNHLGSSLNMWTPGLKPQRIEAVGLGVAGDQDVPQVILSQVAPDHTLGTKSPAGSSSHQPPARLICMVFCIFLHDFSGSKGSLR